MASALERPPAHVILAVQPDSRVGAFLLDPLPSKTLINDGLLARGLPARPPRSTASSPTIAAGRRSYRDGQTGRHAWAWRTSGQRLSHCVHGGAIEQVSPLAGPARPQTHPTPLPNAGPSPGLGHTVGPQGNGDLCTFAARAWQMAGNLPNPRRQEWAPKS